MCSRQAVLLRLVLLTALLGGCATSSSARVANGVAGAVAPCPAPTTNGAPPSSRPSTAPGLSSPLMLPLAVGLAAAGASSSTERCTATGSPGAPVASAAAPGGPAPTTFPDGDAGTFVCATPDGEEDEIVATSIGRAEAACAAMTGEVCACRESAGQ